MSLVRNSTIYLSSNILNALVPFLLLPILTHNLNPGDYGQIAMFQTLINGLAALTGLNTIGAANRYYYDVQAQDELSLYNGACIHVLLLSSLILVLSAALFGAQLSELLSIPAAWIYLAIFVSAGTFIIQFRLAQWQIRERAWNYGFLQVSQSIFVFILTLALLFLIKQGAASRINALLFGTIFFVLISLFTLFKERLLTIQTVNISYIKDALSFGIPLVPHIVGIFFLSAIDRVLISSRLGIEDAGIYMLAVQLSLGMVVVFDAINKAMVPWLFRILTVNDVAKLNKLVKFSYGYFILLTFLGVLSFWIGPLVVNLFAGSKYQEATNVIGWLCLGQAFNGMYLMVTNYLFYAKKTGRLSIITISCGIFNIVLLLIMMKSNGIVGVAIAFSISMCIRFLATWALAWQLKLVSWNIFKKA
ncbi:lipopolysaccharide biosynthesis protein [Enterobacter quasiroggenkampii]|uniref:lipopolysaccharide biosynthesis protein n=1 Tax=Enterobacter quasiroggenkampii TaxID=2497436 RepID=UPI0021D1E53E|nr:oligosaccharide flippase family protein [Enterobacter quasiroggenkampii]MCU6279890.1 oligosaccharide flippase family protein [Enterobacter quasiroggenkampii]